MLMVSPRSRFPSYRNWGILPSPSKDLVMKYSSVMKYGIGIWHEPNPIESHLLTFPRIVAVEGLLSFLILLETHSFFQIRRHDNFFSSFSYLPLSSLSVSCVTSFDPIFLSFRYNSSWCCICWCAQLADRFLHTFALQNETITTPWSKRRKNAVIIELAVVLVKPTI